MISDKDKSLYSLKFHDFPTVSHTTMKLAIVTICLLALAHAAPQNFNFGGMTGVIDGVSIINGEKAEGNSEINRKAEEILKNMIQKHLVNKKQAKKVKAEKAKAAREPVVESQKIPTQINLNDNPESKAINEEIPGGTEAVDALRALLF